jgi:hypothetical protein
MRPARPFMMVSDQIRARRKTQVRTKYTGARHFASIRVSLRRG